MSILDNIATLRRTHKSITYATIGDYLDLTVKDIKSILDGTYRPTDAQFQLLREFIEDHQQDQQEQEAHRPKKKQKKQPKQREDRTRATPYQVQAITEKVNALPIRKRILNLSRNTNITQPTIRKALKGNMSLKTFNTLSQYLV